MKNNAGNGSAGKSEREDFTVNVTEARRIFDTRHLWRAATKVHNGEEREILIRKCAKRRRERLTRSGAPSPNRQLTSTQDTESHGSSIFAG